MDERTITARDGRRVAHPEALKTPESVQAVQTHTRATGRAPFARLGRSWRVLARSAVVPSHSRAFSGRQYGQNGRKASVSQSSHRSKIYGLSLRPSGIATSDSYISNLYRYRTTRLAKEVQREPYFRRMAY
jgi:hypothetical protein